MKPRFKGGPIFLNSGGTGPDDYLLKPLKGGKWVRVVGHFGRHFESKEHAQQDLEVWERLFPVEHIAISDNARRYAKSRDTIPTMCVKEFLGKYGG